ncbi:M61 family metallopeptidase [Persicimonas caeni]|nr:hypothetical protein [Persicimonas caeni]
MHFPRSRHSMCAPAGFGLLVLMVVLCGCQGGQKVADESTFERMVGSAPGSPEAAPERRRGALWYQIEANSTRLEVHVRLLDPPDRASFFLPGPWAGRTDFADNISIQGASSNDGPVPFTISRSDGRIDVESDDAEWIQLDYAVALRHQSDERARFHPRFADGVAFAYGPAFIVLPSEQISRQVSDIPIEVRAPSDWRLLATWQHIRSAQSQAVEGSSVHGFMAPTPGALRDAFVAAGADIELYRPESVSGDSQLTVGFAPAMEVDRQEYGERIAQLVRAYRQRFGDLGPATAFVRPLEEANPSRRRGVGRRGGFVVEVSETQPLDSKTLLLLAHEAFHLWNGHHLTPEPSAEQATRWFKEGVTHYLALKTLAELGLLSREEVLRELSRAGSYYQRNPAARRRKSSTADRARLPYDKGVLLAVALDATLLADSEGRVGLDDWVRHLIEQMGDAGNAYDAEDLRSTLVEVAGTSSSRAAKLWDEHVAGAKPLEPARVFERAGLHWLESSEQSKARLLPVKRDKSPFGHMFPADTSQ